MKNMISVLALLISISAHAGNASGLDYATAEVRGGEARKLTEALMGNGFPENISDMGEENWWHKPTSVKAGEINCFYNSRSNPDGLSPDVSCTSNDRDLKNPLALVRSLTSYYIASDMGRTLIQVNRVSCVLT